MNAIARPLSALSAALLLAGSVGGCEIAKTGEEGNLKFQFTADDRLIPPTFNRPVAVGMRVEVKVTDAGTNQEVTITSASSAAPTILTVPQRSGSRLVLAGEGAGETKISVGTAANGSDTIAVTVAEIDEVELKNPGPLWTPVQGTAQVIQNAKVRFPMTLKSATGGTLIGYGSVPVDVDPTTAGTQVASEDVAHVVFQFSTIGDAMLRPLNGTALPVKVIDGADVTSITLQPTSGGTPPDIKLDSSGWMALKGATNDGSPVVGLADVATVTSTSIAVCSVQAEPKLGDGVYSVQPLAVGDCTLEASFNGQTASLTHKVVAAQ